MRSCKRGGNGVQHVGRGDEEHLREVVVDVEVVILEGGVLLGVENFEQRRGGIAAEVGGDFVDFVEQEDGILGAGALHVLDDLAGHGADVGAAMAANLGFVAHAAQREADKFAAGGLGDGHAERGFAHAREVRRSRGWSLWDFLPTGARREIRGCAP